MFGFLEWNALLDPHAAAMVYRTPVRIHRSIGLDVTTQLNMPAPEVRARFQADLLRPVLDMAEVWFEERDTITFHDPLAACTLFDDHICSFERGLVEIDLASKKVLGMTHWQPGGHHTPHEVALGVDVTRFFERFFSVFD
jgi:purine nucleosidase